MVSMQEARCPVPCIIRMPLCVEGCIRAGGPDGERLQLQAGRVAKVAAATEEQAPRPAPARCCCIMAPNRRVLAASRLSLPPLRPHPFGLPCMSPGELACS